MCLHRLYLKSISSLIRYLFLEDSNFHQLLLQHCFSFSSLFDQRLNMVTQPTTNGNGPSEHTKGIDQSSSSSSSFPVAIIGMSCRFAGEATSPSKLWDLCIAGKDAWSPIPSDRWDSNFLNDKKKGKSGRVRRVHKW